MKKIQDVLYGPAHVCCHRMWHHDGIGCMIEVDGKRIPEDRYRYMGE